MNLVKNKLFILKNYLFVVTLYAAVFAQTTGSQPPAAAQPAPPVVATPPVLVEPTPRRELTLDVPEESVVETFGIRSFDGESGETSAEVKEETFGSIREYEITSGDTLWDVCGKLLDNPWFWPKLWSLNQYITNPHLIYPGNKLKFYGGSETSFPKLEVVTNDEQPFTPGVQAPLKATTKESLYVERSDAIARLGSTIKVKPKTFLSSRRVRPLGKVTYSEQSKILMTYGDRIYLRFYRSARSNLKRGDRFHVVKKIKELRDPDRSNRRVAFVYQKSAIVEVSRISKRTIESFVVSNNSEVEVGDVVIPFREEIKSVTLSETNSRLNGRIIGAQDQQYLIGVNDIVFLNRGSSDGVTPGQQFYVIKTERDLFSRKVRNLPEVIKGKVIVVEVNGDTSLAYVLDVKESLLEGDIARTFVQ